DFIYIICLFCHIFFFQAEDGIRDRNVTGVQTCALPIYPFFLKYYKLLYKKLKTVSFWYAILRANIELLIKSEGFNMYEVHNNYAVKGSKTYIKVIVALFISGFTIFSILYSVQPLIPHFTKSFNVSETKASLALSSATLTLAFAMLFFGAISEVLGRKPIMIFSVLSVSLLALIQPFL